jgi:hypothetical protein
MPPALRRAPNPTAKALDEGPATSSRGPAGKRGGTQPRKQPIKRKRQ